MKRKTALLTILILFTGLATAQNSVQLDVNKVNMEPVPLQTSEYADVWVEVVNNGNTDARNVELEFTENYPFRVDPGEQKNWSIGELVPGEEYLIHLQARVDENAVQGENELVFRTISGANDFSATHKVPVEVRSDNDLLSISEVEFPERIAPGSSHEMSLTVENLADGQIKNIEAKLDLSNIPVATSGTTSQAVTKISSDSSEKISFRLNTDETAENGVYKIPVTLEYENEAGSEFTRETTVGAVVGGTPQLEAGLNSVESELTPGSTETVTLRFVNRGRGSADFVEVQLDDTENFEVLSPKSVYLGDMDPDDYQTADFQINVASDAENISAPVELSYKDVSGEKTDSQTVDVPVYTQSQLERYGMASSGSSLPIVAVVIVLLAGAYYWRRRRN